MLSAADVTGLLALPPSPLKAEGEHLTDADIARPRRGHPPGGQMIDDGAVGHRSVRHDRRMRDPAVGREGRDLRRRHRARSPARVPVWCGTTALGTREVVRPDARGQGARRGRRVRRASRSGRRRRWRTRSASSPTSREAVPDLPVMVYANRFFFKFDFPVEFWQGIAAKAPDGHRDEGRVPADPGAPRRRPPPGELHDRRGHDRDALPPRARHGRPRRGRRRPPWDPEPWVALLDAINAGRPTRPREVLADIEGVPAADPGLRRLRQVQPPAREGPDQRGGLHALRPAPPALPRLPGRRGARRRRRTARPGARCVPAK